MLIRRTNESAIVITQPRHAWLAGQLAQSWGAPGFAMPEPREAIVTAVRLHDIGWLEWDQAPQIDRQSGYPKQFDQVEAKVHTALWTRGVNAALLYGMLPALHISRHGVAIYELTFDDGTARHEQAEAVRVFIRNQQALQERMIANLACQPETAPFVQVEELERVKRFIVAVDTLSLQICWGVADPVTVDDVPTQNGVTSMSLARVSEDRVTIDPWPFAGDAFEIIIEGKRLRPARDQSALDLLLENAPPFIERLTLAPGPRRMR